MGKSVQVKTYASRGVMEKDARKMMAAGYVIQSQSGHMEPKFHKRHFFGYNDPKVVVVWVKQ